MIGLNFERTSDDRDGSGAVFVHITVGAHKRNQVILCKLRILLCPAAPNGERGEVHGWNIISQFTED
jgi:hypothetical protein